MVGWQYRTSVSGRIVDGKVVAFFVTDSSRRPGGSYDRYWHSISRTTFAVTEAP